MINTNLTGFIKKKKSKSNFVVDIMKLINLFLVNDMQDQYCMQHQLKLGKQINRNLQIPIVKMDRNYDDM